MIGNSISEVWRSSRPSWLSALIVLGALFVFPFLVGVLGFDRAFQIIIEGGVVLVLGVVAIARPTWVVMALFVILGLFGQQLVLPGVPFSLRGSEILTGVLVIRWLGERVTRHTKVVHSNLDAPVLVYCVVIAVSVIYGIIAGWDARTAVREGIKLGVIILYFPLKDLLAHDPRLFVRGVIRPLQIGVAISATLAVTGTLFGNDLVGLDFYQPESALNASAVEGISRLEALAPATSFTFVALMGLGQLLTTRKTRARATLFVLIGVAILGVFFTLTRTRWVALGLGALILLFASTRIGRRGDWAKYVTAFAILTAVLWFIPMFVGTGVGAIVDARFDAWLSQGLDYRGGIHRLNEFQAYWNAFLPSPFLGQGLGAEVSFYSPGSGMIVRTYSHNDYAMFIGKTGLVGVLSLVWLGCTAWRELCRAYQASTEQITSYQIISVAAFLVGILLIAASISGFTNFAAGPLVAASLAFITIQSGQEKSGAARS